MTPLHSDATLLRLQRLHNIGAWIAADRRNVRRLADELGYTDYLPTDAAHAVAVLLQWAWGGKQETVDEKSVR